MSSNKKLTEAQVERRNSMIETAKSFIFPAILAALIGVAVLFIINYVNVDPEETLVQPYAYAGDGEPIVIENDDLILTMDSLTTEFTITQKSTGKVWHSTAENGGSDAAALSSEKGKLQSNLLMTYAIETGLKTTYDTHSFSIANGIYEIQVEGDTIKLFYSLGNIEKEYVIPPVALEEDMNYWKDQMPADARGIVSEYYKKYDINNLGKKDNKEELLEKYPALETSVIYVLRDTTKEQLKKTMEGYFEAAGYTYDKYLEDKELDNAEKVSDKPIFNVEMDLTLEGNDLVVTIPFSSIEHKNDYYVYSVTPLPYFGASTYDAKGYMLVPEGGGAIINYNNGKNSQNNYFANVYGWDYDISRADVVHNTRAYFAVFGQATEGSSYLCLMEDGASYASITADISGRLHSYNYVNAEYSVSSREKYDIGDIANSDVYVYREELPDENIVQRYRFYDTEDYVEMAKEYQSYLFDTYGAQYFTLNDDSSVPANLEVVGAVDKVKQILGVPVSRPLELTKFKETEEMLVELTDAGVRNVSIKYTGWANGGVNQKLLKNITIVNGLGGSSGLKKLQATAASNGAQLYLNGITEYEHDSNIFNGFFSYRDAARFLTKERAELHQYSHVTYAMRESSEPYYLLHTELAIKCAENLQKYATKYNAGVSFEDIGMDLSSDFYRKNMYSREEVKNLHTNLLKNMDDAGTNIMINMGNDYAIAYADIVTDMDLKGSEYTILDAEIPFYQIAIHGYVNYTGESLNVCGNDQDELLACVEYGAGLSFTLMKESPFTLQKTLYTQYYGADYDGWKDRLVEIYTRYNNELGSTFNQEIKNHEVINEYVRCTTYEDGTRVYVNYSFTEDYADREGGIVKARDYRVEHTK